MAIEIERKFLVSAERWHRDPDGGTVLRQSYLSRSADCSVRLRRSDEHAWLTIKGPITGISRLEFEYPIPLADAETIFAELALGPSIEKRRYREMFGGYLWEIDVFAGANAGLIMAEVELSDPAAVVELPPWIEREVTGDRRYYNSSLAIHPFQSW
jgi:adenylate cyclase